MLKMRKKIDKDKASLPIPNNRKEKENKASPPTPLLGEGSDMFSNYILFAFYFQGILLPSPWRGVGGEALSLSTFFLIFNTFPYDQIEMETPFFRLCEAPLWLR